MSIDSISLLLGARIVCGQEHQNVKIDYAFASDLMSDVLTLTDATPLLITGLANLQTIRTAEMADIKVIVFARNKKVTPEMIDLANENHNILLECPYSVFRISGLLYQSGIKPVY